MKIQRLSAIIGILLMSLTFSSMSYAAANCAGKVKLVLKWDTQCDGQVAFIIQDGTEKWFCTSDKTDAAIVLTAQASGADLLVRLSDSNLNSCSENPNQYTTPSYIIVTAAG